jgi:thioredoxin 2
MPESTGSATAGATLRCPFCLKLNRVAVNRADDHPKCGSCSRPLLLDRPFKLQGEDLDRLISDAEVDVLVDFYADWCAPCKIMAPVLDEFARDHTGELLVAKLDTDLNPEISQRFSIRGIPTLILFRDGQERERKTGAVPRQQLEEMVQGA